MEFEIDWEGSAPSEDLVAKTREEIEYLLKTGLRAPEDLIFHTVSVGDKPVISVWGLPGVKEFHAYYDPHAEWTTLDA